MKKDKTSRVKRSAGRSLESTMKERSVKNSGSRLVPVHISVEEVIGFNALQATPENPTGQYVDPKTGLREYSHLSQVLRVPKIRDLFIQTSELMFSGKPIPPEIEEIERQPMPGEENGLIPIESDEDPAIQHVAQAGEDQDKILVMMPEDVVHFLDILQGGKNEDPEYGLQEFFSFGNMLKSVVRVAATVVGGVGGFMVGGPAGAAAGAYAGNAVGRGLTGQSMFNGSNPAWRAAAPNALYGLGAGLGASALGYGTTAASGAAPIVNGAASTAPGVTKAATPYVAAPKIAGAGLAPHVVAPAAASSGIGNLISSAKDYLVPGALMAGGYLMTQKGDKQQQKEWEADKQEHAEKIKNHGSLSNEGLSGQMYSQPPMSERIRTGYHLGPYREDDEEEAYLSKKRYRNPRYFKKGGLVKVMSVEGTALKGPGKGQDDLIHKSIPEYTWIHDAHTVSALGDGVTEEGQKELQKFEQKIKKDLLPLYKEKLIRQLKQKKPRNVPCAVANGERETPLLLVGALGKGSFEKGAKHLRDFTKVVRNHKTSKRNELPPASLGASVYYKKALRGE